MSTIEKLIVQIFERKNSIIEQVRHQVELYDQQLASKLLIHGIDPPSWLWNHEALSHFSDSDPSEIGKRRLITNLLLPLPQQPVPYFNTFNYNSISKPECNFDQHDESVTACFDNVRHVPDIAVEVKPAAASPQQQVATRFDDGNSGFDLSRPEFKRSNSRQRALELRSSAKSGSKSHAQVGNVSYRKCTPGLDESIRTSEHICRSIDNVCDTKNAGAVFRGQIDKLTQFQGILNIQLGDTESKSRNTVFSKEENACEAIPSRPLNHELGSTEQGIRCANKTLGVVTGGHIDKISTEKIPSAVAHGTFSPDTSLDVHNSSTTGEVPLPSRISSSKISSKRLLDVVPTLCAAYKDNERGSAFSSNSSQDHPCVVESSDLITPLIFGNSNSGMMKEPIDDHSSSDKRLGKLSPNPVKTESSLQKNSELILHFPAAENDGGISGVSLLCYLSQSHARVLESPQSTSPAVITASPKHLKSSNSSQDHPYVVVSSDLITPFIFGDSNSGTMKEPTDGHSSNDKRFGKLSPSPVKTESTLQKNSELISHFPAAEKEGGISGVSLLCNLSQSHDHVLQSPQSRGPAVTIASPKSSEVKSSELHSSSCVLEGVNSLIEELNVLKTEVEVPQLQSEAVEQPDLQQEYANLTACDSPLLIGVVQDQENIYRVGSVSFYGTSKASNVSHYMQDNIGVEENSKSEAMSTLQKSSSSPFSKNLCKVETESPRFSSHCGAKQQTDDSLMTENTTACFLEGSHLPLDVQEKLNEEHSRSETLSIESASEVESYVAGFEENTFVDCKYDGLMGADQIMPVLEGFVMDTDDGESLFAGGQIDIEEPSLPGSPLKRASFLERLCQSSSRNTPISQFPTTYGLHKTSNLFQSVPTGLFEHISLVGECSNMKLQKKSHSAGQPVSTCVNVSTPYLSPLKNKWDQRTSSSGLICRGSLNPELICFTIEEDPGNCDEIVNHDEAAEAQPSGGSCLKSLSNRKPLTDITEDGNNLLPSVSVNNKDVLEAVQTPKFCFRSQLDSTGTEANLTGAQTRARQKIGKKISNKKRRLNDAKDYRNISVGANRGKQVTDSLKETKSQKPKYSENLKTTTGVSEQPKVLRSNNIVSNISSFIPLVQQKKTAAVAGKRDVKVKALEAAEAARRLAEKKENERKAKKEAWKVEKARLEQENLLQLELKKKKREEELKKKEAEMAARKRIRGEEDKKEKEGKRRRIEEARKQQHEQEKKQADKLTRHQSDGSRINEKDPNTALEQCTKMETDLRKGKVTTEGEDSSTTVPCDTKTMLRDLKESNILLKADISGSNLNKAVSDFDATAEKNPEDKAEVLQSYDISPYQGSDDEDEDEDDESENDRRKEKFVPVWASKKSLAEAVFSQQHINPDEILPSESFCSITEVLIPRKLLAK